MSRFAVESEMADLSAADDVAVRDDASSRDCWNIRPRRSPTTGSRACRASSAKRSTWARAPWSIVCRDEEAARTALRRHRRRASASATRAPAAASSTTRSWKRHFLQRVSDALDATGFWDEFDTDWVCLDCELMPWSAKAQELLRSSTPPSAPPRRPRSARRWQRCSRRSANGVAVGDLLARTDGTAATWSRRIRRRLSPLLLAGHVRRRPEARAVPSAGHRRRGPCRQGSRAGTCETLATLRRPTLASCSPRRIRSLT